MDKLKIGLIDWFIDEFHATCYVPWIRESAQAGDFEIALAWEHHAWPGGRELRTWCRELDVPPAESLEQVLDTCDCFCVLAPSNPEVHETLVAPVLRTGKPVYLDKPFAATGEAAERIFAMADRCGAPLWSSSALRFSDELIRAGKEVFAGAPAEFVQVCGGGSSLEEYLIHLVEMLVALLGPDARRTMWAGKGDNDMLLLDYDDRRRGVLTMLPAFGFTLLARAGEKVVFESHADTKCFATLLDEMLTFFRTGVPPVPRRETIAIARIVETMLRAARRPGEWLDL